MPLRIAQLGQPVLRTKAAPVGAEELAQTEFQSLLDDMIATMRVEHGVGLAAPQVFVSKRVFVAAILPSDTDEPKVEVFVNPRLVATSREKESAWEGCLSFRELMVLVPRHKGLKVEYLDREGKPRALQLVGFPARVFQHEYDHLDGILTIDRAASTRDIVKASEMETVLEGAPESADGDRRALP